MQLGKGKGDKMDAARRLYFDNLDEERFEVNSQQQGYQVGRNSFGWQQESPETRLKQRRPGSSSSGNTKGRFAINDVTAELFQSRAGSDDIVWDGREGGYSQSSQYYQDLQERETFDGSSYARDMLQTPPSSRRSSGRHPTMPGSAPAGSMLHSNGSGSSFERHSLRSPVSVAMKEESVRLLQKQLERMQAVRVESQEKDKRILELHRQLEELQCALDDKDYTISRLRKETSALAARKEEDEKGNKLALEKQIEKLTRQLEETRRSLHEAEHAQAVLAREASIAVEAREAGEKSSLERVSNLQEELRVVRSEKQTLLERISKNERRMEVERNERQSADAETKAKFQALADHIKQLRTELAAQISDKENLHREIEKLKQYEDLERETKNKLAIVEDRFSRMNVQVEEIQRERSLLLEKLEKERQDRDAQEKIRILAEERCRTLRDQVDMLVAGNNAMQLKKDDFERLKREAESALRLAENRESQIQGLNKELASARTKLDNLGGDMDTWTRLFQFIHHRVAAMCAGGSSNPSSSTDLVEDWLRMHGGPAPEGVRALFGSLDALDKMQCQVKTRVAELEDQISSNSDESLRSRDMLSDFRSKIEMQDIERDQMLSALSTQKIQIVHLQEEVEELQCALQTLQEEMENERRDFRHQMQTIRRTSLRALAAAPLNASSRGLNELGVESTAEEVVHRVCSLLEQSFSREQDAQNTISDLLSKQSKVEAISKESRKDSACTSEILGGSTARAWKLGCILFARVFVGSQELIQGLVAHKAILMKLSHCLESRNKALRGTLRKTRARIKSLNLQEYECSADGAIMIDRECPSIALRTVVLAVIASKRLEILLRFKKEKRFSSPIEFGKWRNSAEVENMTVCPSVVMRLEVPRSLGDVEEENTNSAMTKRVCALFDQGEFLRLNPEICINLLEILKNAGVVKQKEQPLEGYGKGPVYAAAQGKYMVDKEMEDMDRKLDDLSENIRALTTALRSNSASSTPIKQNERVLGEVYNTYSPLTQPAKESAEIKSSKESPVPFSPTCRYDTAVENTRRDQDYSDESYLKSPILAKDYTANQDTKEGRGSNDLDGWLRAENKGALDMKGPSEGFHSAANRRALLEAMRKEKDQAEKELEEVLQSYKIANGKQSSPK